jgi:putative ABC transport system ATP-binding protein
MRSQHLATCYGMVMIELKALSKAYRQAGQALPVLRGVDLRIDTGEFVAIMGPSGSGKSTLLHVLGLLDGFDNGEYWLAGVLIRQLSERQAARYRNRLIGFVFQAFNLLPFLSAWENVALPLQYQGIGRRERQARACTLLERVNLGNRLWHYPHQLSGGQQQRVAIARALVTQPRVILADEPTGNLDSATSYDIMQCFAALHCDGATIVMVTHEDEIAACTQRVIYLRDGQVV